MQGRIAEHKSKIKQLVVKYNCIRAQGSSSRPADITEEGICEGDFPWAFRSIPEDAAGTPSPGDRSCAHGQVSWCVVEHCGVGLTASSPSHAGHPSSVHGLGVCNQGC